MRRTRKDRLLAGTTGTARVAQEVADLLPRLQPGDIVILDQDELADDDAAALVEAGAGGVVLVGDVDDEEWERLEQQADGAHAQLHAGVVHTTGATGTVEVLARGRAVDLSELRTEPGPEPAPEPDPEPDPEPNPPTPRTALEELDLRTALAGRPVVVVDVAEHGELTAVRPLVRESRPALLVIGAATDDLLAHGWAPDVVLLTAGVELPSSDALHVATDVVLLTSGDAEPAEVAELEQLGVTPHLLETRADAREVALDLAQHHGARVVVTVGFGEGTDGAPVVAADTVRALTGPGTSTRLLAAVLVVGVLALLLAVAVTPVGNGWLHGLGDTLGGLL